jgi:hypothetical protein
MSRRIDDWDGPGTGFVVTDAIAYLDTITLFCWRRLPGDVLGSLRRQYGRRLIVEEFRPPRDAAQPPGTRWWFITIHQPEDETLNLLSTIQHNRFVVHAAHVAVDFICRDRRHAQLATKYLTRGLVQKWRRRDRRSHLEPNTLYWKQDGKDARNIVLYGHRVSKTGRGSCSHLEFRFTSASACKRVGLGDPVSLIVGIDVMALLSRQAKIAFIDRNRLDRAIEKLARRKLSATRRHQPDITVQEIKDHFWRMLPRCIQDEGIVLDRNSITEARSQELWDRHPYFRSCLAKPVDWASFTPAPKWWRW